MNGDIHTLIKNTEESLRQVEASYGRDIAQPWDHTHKMIDSEIEHSTNIIETLHEIRTRLEHDMAAAKQSLKALQDAKKALPPANTPLKTTG